jgi:hypothetical protein
MRGRGDLQRGGHDIQFTVNAHGESCPALRAFPIQVFTLAAHFRDAFSIENRSLLLQGHNQCVSGSTEAFFCILQHKSNRRLPFRESPEGTTQT